jgi:peptide-methionine (S)-S-oxide reductase
MTVSHSKDVLISAIDALPGRDVAIATADTHFVTGRPVKLATPDGMDEIILGLGCFWGAERIFWQTPGVWHTAVGYVGGHTPNPTYEEVCSGRTAHTEAVRVVYDPAVISLDALLKVFWEGHDPTQGMRQGNDRGTAYRSYVQHSVADRMPEIRASRDAYQAALTAAARGSITTELAVGDAFYYAEDYHQQYLAKNPAGYCGLGGTGVVCPIGSGVPG